MNEETLDQLVDQAASETAATLRGQRLSAEDRSRLSSALRGEQGPDVMRAFGLEADIDWKDAFCAVWPFIKGWLERLKENAPIWIRWLIGAVIRFGNSLCAS
jgi:hypothetical protein